MALVILPGLNNLIEDISEEKKLPANLVEVALREALLKGYEKYRRTFYIGVNDTRILKDGNLQDGWLMNPNKFEQLIDNIKSRSFIADKFGFHTADGPDHVGQVFIEDLGVLQQDIRPCAHMLNQQALKQALPAKKQNSHKHQFGHVLAIGGTAGMLGALVLAAQGAFAAGAGLVTMASCKGHAEALAIHFTKIELIFHIQVNGEQCLGIEVNQNIWNRLI